MAMPLPMPRDAPVTRETTSSSGLAPLASSFAIAPPVDADRLAHDVQRALLDLLVDPADVLAEDPDRDQLHAAEEQHAHDRRGEPGDLLVHREEGDHVEDREPERED